MSPATWSQLQTLSPRSKKAPSASAQKPCVLCVWHFLVGICQRCDTLTTSLGSCESSGNCNIASCTKVSFHDGVDPSSILRGKDCQLGEASAELSVLKAIVVVILLICCAILCGRSLIRRSIAVVHRSIG